MKYLSYFHTTLIEAYKERYFDSSQGALGHYLAYMLEGQGTFNIRDQVEHFKPGQILYIPKGLIYRSQWQGNPRISFISFMFDFTSSVFERQYAFQILTPDDSSSFDDFNEINRLSHAGGSDEMRAIGQFYQLCANVIGRLKPSIVTPLYQRLLPALHRIEDSFENCSFTNNDLADLCFMSLSSFYSAFRKEFGYTPAVYKSIIRARHTVHLLTTTNVTLEDICAQMGFSSPSHLRRSIRKITGMTPREIRQNGGIIP